MKLFSALLIMRPANIITAISDIIAGVAIAGFFSIDILNDQTIAKIALLILSTIGLYGGGIVFNDVLDLEQDKINRPERVIPSGGLSLNQAILLGVGLFIMGIISAFLVSVLSGYVATIIMLLALLYNVCSKHNKFFGPLNMGLCRGVNLILGMSINVELQQNFFWIAIVPILFVSAITLTAQKENKGKNKVAIIIAMFLDICVVVSFFLMSLYLKLSLKNTAFFIILWYCINIVYKLKALLNNKPSSIKKAVKLGVLSLIPLNASYTAGFSSIYVAFSVLCLLPLSLYLSKKFPVT